MTKPVLLVGAGGHARACIDVIEQEARFHVVGLLGLRSEVGTIVLGYPVLGTDEDLVRMLTDGSDAIVTVGQIKSADLRVHLFELLVRRACSLPVIISPRAYVSPHATIGAGSIVMHGAVVNAGAVIGRNCIINSQSLVEHDVSIADHCHIATAATINSGVRIGMATFVGSGSSVRQGIIVGEHCVVGMGARVVVDCKAGTRFVSDVDPS